MLRRFYISRCMFSSQICDIPYNDHLTQKKLPFERKSERKILKVAIIGPPNVGKSTLINGLAGRRICSVSCKVHTTRKNIKAASIEGDTQFIFLDTPGLVTGTEIRKHRLERSFISDVETAMLQADVIGVVHDVSNKWTLHKLDLQTLRVLQLHSSKQSFLVLNKVDIVTKKHTLLNIVDELTGKSVKSNQKDPRAPQTEFAIKSNISEQQKWPHFSEVFMVSALTGSGLHEMKEYLLHLAKPGKWLFNPDKYTDKSPEEIILETVYSRLLENLPNEIPYIVKPLMEFLNTKDDGLVVASVVVKCPTSRLAKLVVGPGGRKIKHIARQAEQDLRDTFHESVVLKVAVTGPTES